MHTILQESLLSSVVHVPPLTQMTQASHPNKKGKIIDLFLQLLT